MFTTFLFVCSLFGLNSDLLYRHEPVSGNKVVVSEVARDHFHSHRRKIRSRRHFHDVRFVRVEFAPGYGGRVYNHCLGYGLTKVTSGHDFIVFKVNSCQYETLVKISNYKHVRFVHPHYRHR